MAVSWKTSVCTTEHQRLENIGHTRVQHVDRVIVDRTQPVDTWQEGNNLDDALLPGSSPRIKSSAALAKPPSAPPPAEQC